MAIKRRCVRCLKHLRDDGTCQNPACVKYIPEGVHEVPEGAEVLEVYEEPAAEK